MKEIFTTIFSFIGEIGVFTLVASLLTVLIYELSLVSFRKQTEKYTFASIYEVKFLKAASTLFAVSITLLVFDFITRVIARMAVYEYYFVAFVALGIGILFGYGLTQYFKVYYPFILEKKLSRIRFKPRKSPKTGKPMTLLNELEEDAHLTEEMIANEESFTYDYDVWLDEETGYKLIERYDGHLHALVCSKCNFRTMKDYHEVVVQSPGPTQKGLLQKHYRCSYCNHEEIREVKIPSIQEERELAET